MTIVQCILVFLSRNFAAGVCDKVVAMTQGKFLAHITSVVVISESLSVVAVTTPMLQKLKLLPVLEHLYYDLETANKVGLKYGSDHSCPMWSCSDNAKMLTL